jgi:restriction system protein
MHTTTATITVKTFADVLRLNWRQFELFAQWLLQKEAYKNTEITRKHGATGADRGIDLLCDRDGLKYAVQCKHWNTDWNQPGEHLPLTRAIRELGGCLRRDGIGHGLFITTARYTYDQVSEARDMDIQLISHADITRILERAGPCHLPQ